MSLRLVLALGHGHQTKNIATTPRCFLAMDIGRRRTRRSTWNYRVVISVMGLWVERLHIEAFAVGMLSELHGS